jgi:3-oxoacyl-[acyl-carrier protein] reductase
MTTPTKKLLALVTGASGNIGSAVARRLARNDTSVLVHFGNDQAEAARVVREIHEAGGEAEMIGADLSHRDGATTLIGQLDRTFDGRFAGRLDILVNNAGALDTCSITEVTDDSIDSLFNLNVRAVVQLTREASRRMTKTGWGRIINMGSVFGEATPFPGLSIYCGTKFAIQGLTRGWSRDLGPTGITVNNIQPAAIQAEPFPTSGPAFEAMQRLASVGRFGKPEEVADLIAFLVSPQASFINGACLNIDGGWGA